MKDNLILKTVRLFKELGSIRAVAAQLMDEGDLETQLTASRLKVKSILEANGEFISVEAKNDNLYTVIDDSYFWKINDDKIINIPVSVIDKMFFDYSEHGKDLTGVEIMHKYNLEPWQFHSIKSRLNLYKKSNIFSPYTVENTETQDLDKLIQEKIQDKFARKGELVAQIHKRVEHNEYKKVINKDASNNLIYQEAILDLLDNFPIPEKIQVKQFHINTFQHEHLIVPFADFLIGAQTENLPNTLPYNTDILKSYLEEAAYQINSYKAKHVNIFLLGDLIATLTGLNHKNSWQGLQHLMWGNNVIITAFELIEYLISMIHNIESVDGISGNHDRFSAANDLDVEGGVAANIFYMLKRVYNDIINVGYKTDTLYREIDKIGYIILHGHKPYVKRNKEKAAKGSDLVMRYGDNKLFNVILSGHLHERSIVEDDSKFRWYQCPAIFTGDRYSEDGGWYSLPGFYVLYNNGNNIVEMKDYTFS